VLTIPEQLLETIERATRVLVVFRANGEGDAIGSALAFARLLERMEKKVDVVSDGFVASKVFSFLPTVSTILPSVKGISTFTIDVDTSLVTVSDVETERQDNRLRILITPEEGTFRAEDVTYETSPFRYDCIIAIDTPDLESLGNVYEKHQTFFYGTPLINIDHDPANEHYGQMNVVDVTASSTGEVVFGVIDRIGKQYLDAPMATMLLTAMIARTRSFRTPRITPRTLQITSELAAAGADREKIMHELYRTRSLATLKLWGRVLSRLQHDPEIGLAWSSLTLADFERTGATEEHLSEIVDELIANAADVHSTALIYEDPSPHAPNASHGQEAAICVILSTTPPRSAIDLLRDYEPKGTKDRVCFHLTAHTIQEAHDEVIALLKQRLKPTK
jgi:nanoRNase/pAp phosphatase (c-di-AMP/oligoRNAs hydrolase)